MTCIYVCHMTYIYTYNFIKFMIYREVPRAIGASYALPYSHRCSLVSQSLSAKSCLRHTHTHTHTHALTHTYTQTQPLITSVPVLLQESCVHGLCLLPLPLSFCLCVYSRMQFYMCMCRRVCVYLTNGHTSNIIHGFLL